MLNDILAFFVLLVRLSCAYFNAIFRLIVSPSKVCVRGKVVVLTGSGSGLGRQLALRLAAEGARLALWDISETGNKQTAGLIRSAIPDAKLHLYTVDVTDKELVKTSALRVQSELGEVYMLVNNAGVLVGESLLELKDEDIERTLDINLLSAFWILRAFLPAMLQTNQGHIVTTCSMSAVNAMHRLTDYSASKAGIRALDEALELELRDVYCKTGIKQSLILPHFLHTGLIHATQHRGTGMTEPSDAADHIVDGILRQKRFIYFPKIFSFSPTLKGLLPHDASLALLDFLQIRIPSQRLGRPHED